MSKHREIWNKFCHDQQIAETGKPLFHASAEGVVATVSIGSSRRRQVLRRSPEMENLVLRETDKLVEDWKHGRGEYDGLIYIMYTTGDRNDIAPLYIGKTETIGKRRGNLSANIENLHRDKSKFARWGDNFAYHIGDLSAVAVADNRREKAVAKYSDWASTLFVKFPDETPRLKLPVSFWAKAWRHSEVGIWKEFGPTRLTFLEYLLIGVASSAFPELLLNREGQNRK